MIYKDTLVKRDKTRLKNLLKEYEAHIITVRANKYTHIEPVDHVNEIKWAINIIVDNLN